MSGPLRAGRFDIADIVRAHRKQLEACSVLSRRQRRVLTDIAQCRTEALGGHLEQCTACHYEKPVYRSCRNRHCPKCQALAQEKWIEEQRKRTLDVPCFHIVFTLPAELRSLAAFAPRVVYDRLFQAVGRTLLEFGARHLKATVGATLVLHTWTRALAFHPHIHAVVTAGGLAHDASRFQRASRKFLFPVRALGLVLPNKLLDLLWKDYRAGRFRRFCDFQDPEGFQRLVNRLPKRWYVYTKPPFDDGHYVLDYLGRYTHRVAIANSRLLAVQQGAVTFRTKAAGTETLHPVEFLRRFCRHVLPDGFHKIRHVGLNASPEKRAQARCLLEQPPPPVSTAPWWQRLLLLTGRDVSLCPHCRAPLRSLPLARSRAPPVHFHPRLAS